MASGSGTATAQINYQHGGEARVVKPPKGYPHKATVVWLHGLGEDGLMWTHYLENLEAPNIKFICLTAPSRFVRILCRPATAWFDFKSLSEDDQVDFHVLDHMAAAVAKVLSHEQDDVKLFVGGFGMGAAAALYCAACYGMGKHINGSPYTARLRGVVVVSGWLPGLRVIEIKLQESDKEAIERLRSLQLLISHTVENEYVPPEHGERAFRVLHLNGLLPHMEHKRHEGLDHSGSKSPEVMNYIGRWLNARIGLS